jgi:ribosome-associated protein
MEKVSIRDEYIKLGQLLKLAGLSESGAEAKIAITEGKVKLNGEIVLERGKKIYPGDVVSFCGKNIEVENKG